MIIPNLYSQNQMIFLIIQTCRLNSTIANVCNKVIQIYIKLHLRKQNRTRPFNTLRNVMPFILMIFFFIEFFILQHVYIFAIISDLDAFVQTYYFIFKLFLINNTILYSSYKVNLIGRERESKKNNKVNWGQ